MHSSSPPALLQSRLRAPLDDRVSPVLDSYSYRTRTSTVCCLCTKRTRTVRDTSTHLLSAAPPLHSLQHLLATYILYMIARDGTNLGQDGVAIAHRPCRVQTTASMTSRCLLPSNPKKSNNNIRRHHRHPPGEMSSDHRACDPSPVYGDGAALRNTVAAIIRCLHHIHKSSMRVLVMSLLSPSPFGRRVAVIVWRSPGTPV